VVGLQMGVEDRDDRRALRLGQRDVIVDEVDVRIDDGKRAVAPCSPARSRRTRSRRSAAAGSTHAVLHEVELIDLTSYQVIY
jgi:hypothetical protein